MDKIDSIVQELKKLVEEADQLLGILDNGKQLFVEITMQYECWYTKALRVINQIVPERMDDFVSWYKRRDNEDLTYYSYSISDYNNGRYISKNGGSDPRGSYPAFDFTQACADRVRKQVALIETVMTLIPSTLRDMRFTLQAELFDNNIEAAKELLKANCLRSAGVICGVVLEVHLKAIAKLHNIEIEKHSTLGELNNVLKEKEVYDIPRWRSIQTFSDIRNLCSHDKGREPTYSEAEDIILGTEKVIREVI